ncbi:phosphoribosyltransferase [Candidatus Geothermarchaeota archaeon]|nr:MAG: phosphoribosyltransferase [Candidatus Geothermarchaeota archaeon]
MKQTKFFSPTLNDIYEAVLDICAQIVEKGLSVDVIVGISRGGLVPSRLFSDILDVNQVEIVKAEYYTGIMEKARKPVVSVPEDLNVKNMNVLLVDDVADTGDTLIEVEKELLKMGAANVYKATLYVKPWNKAKIDFYHRMVDAWIIFPWEIAETIRVAKESERGEVYKAIRLPDRMIKKICKLIKGKGSKN